MIRKYCGSKINYLRKWVGYFLRDSIDIFYLGRSLPLNFYITREADVSDIAFYFRKCL